MKDVERTITTAAPLERVWAYLTDFTNAVEWDPPTQRCERLSGDGGVGTTYRNVSSMAGKDVEIEYTVTEHEPLQRFRLQGTATGMGLLDTITFRGGPEGTTVTYRAEFHPQGVAKLAEPLLPLGMEKLADSTEDQMRTCLARLAA